MRAEIITKHDEQGWTSIEIRSSAGDSTGEIVLGGAEVDELRNDLKDPGQNTKVVHVLTVSDI